MKSKSKQIVRACTIFGIIIIPLLYSYFYLGAFWDPYSKLDKVPVAIVNLDKGATINGKDRNLGKEMCDELKEDGTLKFVFTNESDAKSGTEGNTYYAMITIPQNFSSSIASASTTDKHIAQLNYSSNEKRNYLASQILSRAVLQIEDSLKAKVSSEIVAELCDKLKSTPDKLTELADGLSQLSDGSSKLKDGAGDLSDGTNQLKSGLGTLINKMSEYSDGVKSASDGSDSLLSGANQLQAGIDKLADGAKTLDDSTANIDELRKSAKLLADNTKTFNDGIISYTDGVSTLISTVENTSTFLTTYVTAHPQLMQDATFSGFIKKMSDPANTQNIAALKTYTASLKDASAKISAGMTKLSDATAGIPTLKEGITQLKNGLISAQSGAKQLASGTKTLNSGISSLNEATQKILSATNQLSDGSGKVDDGASKLSEGASDLNNGINTAKDSVNSSITDANDQIKSLNGLSDYAQKPVEVNENAINPVPNYGTAFAPYFLCLSLWVGALIIFVAIYLDADNKFKILSRDSDNKVLRCFIYLLIGLAQAVVLGIALKYCLGLTINHMALYFFAICLSSMVYIAIVQFFMVFFKDLGKFISIALLILQLTSCGGTFPMETVPTFFNVIYPFMPMTYSVGLLKEAISGTTTTYALSNSLVLIGILVVFTLLTLICGAIKSKRSSLVVETAA